MSKACSIKDVLTNMNKESSKLFRDAVRENDATFSYKFGPNNRFKTEQDVKNHLKLKEVQLESFTKSQLPGASSIGMINYSTDGNKVIVRVQPTTKFTEVLERAFNEKYQPVYEESSKDSFTDKLNKVVVEHLNESKNIDRGFAAFPDEDSSEEELAENISINDSDYKGDFEKHKSFIENLITQAVNKLNSIKTAQYDVLNQIKKSNSTNVKELEDLLVELNTEESNLKYLLEGDPIDKTVIGLNQQLDEMEKNPSLSKILHYVNNGFTRLDQLLKSDNITDLNEAVSLINYYEAIGTFEFDYVNPLFSNDEIFDNEGNIVIKPEIKEELERIAGKAAVKRLQLESKTRNLIEKEINNLSTVSKYYKEEHQNFETLFSMKNGLKDASEIDKFLMDTTNGIFSHNGIIPQAMQSILHNAYDSALVKAKHIEERVDYLTPKVIEILKANGHSYGGFGINGVNYEAVFRAQDEAGNYRDGYVSRFSKKFKDNYQFRFDEFKKQLELSRSFPKEEYKKAIEVRKKAYENFNNWVKSNTEVVDISKLPEFSGKFDGLEINGDESYKDYLIDLLGGGDTRVGKIAYNEMLVAQEEKIRAFLSSSNLVLENALKKEGVSKKSDLSPDAHFQYDKWFATNNPLSYADNIHRNKHVILKAGPSGTITENSSQYNYLIPKRKVTEVYDQNIDTGDFKTREVETKYYDERFKFIEKEGNEALKEFHNLLLETTETVYNALDSDGKKDFGRDNLLHLDKSFTEILTNKDKHLMARISEAARVLYEKLLNMFSEKINQEKSGSAIDVITGLPTEKVNSSFFSSTKGEVNNMYNPLSIIVQDMFKSKDRKFNNFYKKSNIPTEYNDVIDGLIGKDLRVKLYNSYEGDQIPVFKVLQKAVEHKVISNQSFDLPKIMKYYSFSAMEYQARTEALPILSVIKEHYKNIKKPATTAQGKSIINTKDNDSIRKDGLRVRANAQMDSWFNRAVLGNYNTKNEFGDTSGKFNTIDGTSRLDDALNKRLRIAAGYRPMTKKEKELNAEYETALQIKQRQIESIDDKGSEQFKKLTNEYNALATKQAGLGSNITLTSILDGIFDFIRLKGLGWNLSSQTTNYLEGQIANTISAASGKYFSPENIYRANSIVGGSIVKNTSFGKFSTDSARKARILMDRFRVLQDTSNELQKASTQSSYTQAADLVAPYTLMKRVEYLNQTPLMIATLLDVKVTDKDGANPISVWDAMNEKGEFIDGYNTEKNNKNWVEVNGQEFFDYSQKLGKVIVNVHGDYHQFRGNMASEYISGKAILMFKRWFSRQVYNRFGVEQDDIETGERDKGRYRSLTLPTAIATGAAVGFTGAALIGSGGLGLFIGGAIGLGYGSFTANKSGVGLLEESTFVLKEAFLNLVKMPVNTLSNAIGKGNVISETDYSKFSKMEEIDLKNFKSNITELSLLLALNALTIMMKGLLWDDDDDDESLRRKAHNLIINKLMGLSGQATTYLNPVEMKDMLFDITFLKFLDDVRETAKAAGELMAGNDTLMSGPNAGGSKFAGQLEKTFLPSAFKSGFGFGTQMQRQFEPSSIDSWFYGEEKESQQELRRMKAEYKKSIGYEDLSEEEQKELNSVLGGLFNKSSDQDYTQKLEEVKDQLENTSIEEYMEENSN